MKERSSLGEKTTKKELKERKIFDVLQNHYYLM